MDGWMTCNFTSLLTIFQSYEDDRWVIMKGLCNGIQFASEKIPASGGSRTQHY